MFCQKCGGKIESYASHCAFCGTPVEKYDAEVKYVQRGENGERQKHMSAWKWIGFYLLPVIPLVGSLIQIILIFKWAFGSACDLSVKGYARAQLIIALFSVLLVVGLFAFIFTNPDILENLQKYLEENANK